MGWGSRGEWVKALDTEFKDYCGTVDTIDWWMWELEFGKHGKAAVSENDKVYDLETPEQLYDFLIGENK